MNYGPIEPMTRPLSGHKCATMDNIREWAAKRHSPNERHNTAVLSILSPEFPLQDGRKAIKMLITRQRRDTRPSFTYVTYTTCTTCCVCDVRQVIIVRGAS